MGGLTMNEEQLQSWKKTRENGFGRYFLRNVLSYIVIFIILDLILNGITSLYSTTSVLFESLLMSIVIIVVQTSKWFYREKKYKECLKAFNIKD